MGGHPRLDLSAWSLDDLCEAEDAIEGTLQIVLKVGTVGPTSATEAKLAKEMLGAWKRAADKGLVSQLGALLRGRVTEGRISTFVKKLGLGLKNPLTKKQIEVLKSRLTSIWKTAKRIAAKEAKTVFSFTQVDAGAVAAIGRHQVFWVGNLYDQHLSTRIAAVADDVLLRRGLPQAEAGRVLRQALMQEMSLRPGGRSRFARAIPSRYAGNVDLYFRQVAANAAHQARSFSKMVAYKEGGIVRYQLINPNDRRTGQICQHMHGQTFTVSQGLGQMRSMMAATKPDDIKAAAPWLSAEELDDALQGTQRGSQAASDALANADASVLPPFHPLCRTEPVVID